MLAGTEQSVEDCLKGLHRMAPKPIRPMHLIMMFGSSRGTNLKTENADGDLGKICHNYIRICRGGEWQC